MTYTDASGNRLTPGKITDRVRVSLTTAQLRNELAGKSNKAKIKAAAKRAGRK